MFTVGQKVICKQYGEGVVYCVDDDETYPVCVELAGGWACYTKDGKLYKDDDEPCLSVRSDVMFTVGQEVFSPNYGKGVVTRIDGESLFYSVEVMFHDGSVEGFTQSGKEFISEDQPSLVKV